MEEMLTRVRVPALLRVSAESVRFRRGCDAAPFLVDYLHICQ